MKRLLVVEDDDVVRRLIRCVCGVAISEGSRIDAHALLTSGEKEYLGQAQVIRSEWNDTHYPLYACRFTKKPTNWVLQ